MVLVLYKIRSIYPFMQETHRTMYGKTSPIYILLILIDFSTVLCL